MFFFFFFKQKTAYEIIRTIKKTCPNRKVGHGGTLDPLAEGVLVVAIGREFTKKLHTVLKNTSKTYEVGIYLGKWSETDDAEGPFHTVDVKKEPSMQDVTRALAQFVGKILQKPPIYSAVKLHGTPAYKRARRGEKIEIKEKTVTIESIVLNSYTYPHLTCTVVCGSGVYMRSLARDVGQLFETGAYVESLLRTRVGAYDLSKALQIGK